MQQSIGNLLTDAVEEEEVPETEVAVDRALRGFTLPKLEAIGKTLENNVKMPPLPLKSVLRKKREAMGIKVRTPLVSDLAAREGGNADQLLVETGKLSNIEQRPSPCLK